MPTIVDSLLVKLGLDAKDYDAGKKKVDKGLKETGDEAEKAGKKLKKTGKDGADGFEVVAKSATKFLAIIGGTVAVKRFVTDMIESNAALDRLSRNLETSANTVSAWSNAAEIAGGTAEGLQGTMDMLNRSQTELQLTGQSSLIPYLSALGVAMADVNGKGRPVDDLLLDLSDRFSKLDRSTANNMGRMMGIDQGTMNLLLKGRSEVELMIKRQREYGAVTKQQAEESSKLREQIVRGTQTFAAFGRELISAAAPALEKLFSLFDGLGDWMRENKEFVQTFLTIMAVGLGAVAAAAIPINLTIAAVLALAAGIALLYQDYQTWKRGGDSLIDWGKWEPGITAAKIGLTFLKNLLVDMLIRAVAVGDAILKLVKGDFSGAKLAGKIALYGIPGQGLQASDPQDTAAPASPAKPATGTTPEAATMAYFQAQGWTREQAAGLAANIKRESGFKADSVGDNGKAYGIGQWHPDRQAEFKKRFGKDIRGSSLEEQLAFMQYELTQGGERNAGDLLRKATRADEAAGIVSKNYERPADREGEAATRGKMALALLGRVPGASQFAARAGAASAAQTAGGVVAGDRTVETHIGEIKVYTAAKDADGIAKDMGNAMDYLFTSQANYGLN